MLKAHSLLYAIYICLIVSIICGALLFYANLYGQLNIHYSLQEELYIQNQSVTNYALGNMLTPDELVLDKNSGIQGNYESKKYGLLTLLLAKTWVKNDTVTSAHFVGYFNTDHTAIYLANLSRSLFYSGTVKIIGDTRLSSPYIDVAYINNKPNKLIQKGTNLISEIVLPEINPEFKKIFLGIQTQETNLSDIDKRLDSFYYNSFFNEPIEIKVNSILTNVIFKGNFVLKSKDSIRVKKNVVLEDVILMAPKITFEEGFSGTVQAFATERIELEQNVTLNYPSVVCLFNESKEEGIIKIKKQSKITGAIVLFGNPFESIDKNSIEIEEEGLIIGDIYCTGKLFLKSKVYGSVYTNKFYYKTQSSNYENTIIDTEINVMKRPPYFVSFPLINSKKTEYGILKKVL